MPSKLSARAAVIILGALAWLAFSQFAPNKVLAQSAIAVPACNCLSSRQNALPPGQTGHAWQSVETANLQVWARGKEAARRLSERAEQELESLRQIWPTLSEPTDWQPKCVLVLHNSLAEYQHAIRNPRDRSVGMSTFSVKGHKISARRIDLRADAPDWESGALPHELTHLVLADSFTCRPLPLWIGEGLAVLAECPHKQASRRDVLERALANRQTLPLAELLASADRPPAGSLDLFYTQSASLAEFLVAYRGREPFRLFVECAHKRGPAAALRETYGIEGASHLETLWKRHLLAARAPSSSDHPGENSILAQN